jgi:hypothetical protein
MRDSLDFEHNIPTGNNRLKSPLADLSSYRGVGNLPDSTSNLLGATMGDGIFSNHLAATQPTVQHSLMNDKIPNANQT